MSLRKISFLLLSFALVIFSCEEENGLNRPEPIDLEEKKETDNITTPKFCDNVLIAYEGFRVADDLVFDSRLNPNPSLLDLTGTIEGWKLVIPEFNTSASSVDNGDGTISYTNSGLGMMFLPAGLGYLFNNNNALQLQPLAFKFEVIKAFENDHDSDGVPSYLEELSYYRKQKTSPWRGFLLFKYSCLK